MTITVGVDTYVTVAEANTYLAQSVRARTAWDGLGTDDKEAALVSAAREMEKQRWVGTRTGGSAQALAWPRTGVTDREDEPVGSSVVPNDIKYGQIEWAYDLSQDATLEGQTTVGGVNEKRLKAGSVEIENFRPVDGRAAPSSALGYLAHYLRTGGDGTLPAFSGSGAEGTFTGDDFRRCEGFS